MILPSISPTPSLLIGLSSWLDQDTVRMIPIRAHFLVCVHVGKLGPFVCQEMGLILYPSYSLSKWYACLE